MKVVPLSQIADFINGHAFKPSDWGDEGLKIIRIQNLTDGNKPFNRTTKVVPDKYLVQKGDLLVSWSATLGVFEWENDENALLNQHIFKVEPKLDIIDKSYFKYVLRYSIEKMLQFTHGSTMKHIVRGDFLNHEVPLPSLEEQRKIVKLLDHANELRQKRKQSIDLLDEYLKSLFLDMFGDPAKNPKIWPESTLGEVCSSIKDGPHVSPKYVDDGIPFLSVNNIIKGYWDFSNVRYISKEDHKEYSKKSKPEKGDVLYTKGGTTGFAKYIDIDLEFSNWVHLAVLKFDRKILDGIFLEKMLNTKYCYRQSQLFTRGIANRDLVLGQMKRIKLYLPPLSLQKQFVNVVINSERVRQKMLLQSEEMDNQFHALMHKSFSAKN